MTELTQAAVRALLIAAQGLEQKPQRRTTRNSVRDIIRQMHVLQIDTISVVARSPYLVLWSRLGDYEPRWLENLLAEGHLFEYWSHAACFLPIEDYHLYRPAMLGRSAPFGRPGKWLDEHRDVADRVLNHVREKGEVRSSDFERTDGQKGTWWNWKEEKIALEYLFYTGDLMIARRHNFQRIYNLQERILPDWNDSRTPDIKQVHQEFILNTVKALGVTRAEWVADYFRLKKTEALPILKELDKQGRIKHIAVEGWKSPGYYLPDNEKLVRAAAGGVLPTSKTTLLSPFDPIVWDRARALDLFNFDYRIECYTPEPKRIYGYFTLPILHNNAIIGRLDPKAHRKDGLFEVKALHLEPGVVLDEAAVDALKTALYDCAVWHKTPEVVVRKASQRGLAKRLSS
ncbi:MAG: crosslink repair DNA glycosylase YcaQ family protein [Anaerolineae bacterium]